MNMIKKNGGFTLVELIVVIAILAILAGVAVPAYSGYISKANEAADMTLLDSVKTAVVFDVMEQNPSATVTKIVVTEGGALNAVSVTCTVAAGAANTTVPTTADITDYVSAIDFKSNNNTATWESTGTNANKWVLSTTGGSQG